MASSLKPFKDDSLVTPQQQAAAQQQPYQSPKTGWTQLKDRKGNLTDVYLPPGILAPVGWYPGDPPILSEEETAQELFPETPVKTVLPKDYDQTTGCTPAGAYIDEWRCAFKRPGVPGDTKENSFNLATPDRGQE